MTWLEFHNDLEKHYRNMTRKDEIQDVEIIGPDGEVKGKVVGFKFVGAKLVIETDLNSESPYSEWRDKYNDYDDGCRGC